MSSADLHPQVADLPLTAKTARLASRNLHSHSVPKQEAHPTIEDTGYRRRGGEKGGKRRRERRATCDLVLHPAPASALPGSTSTGDEGTWREAKVDLCVGK